MAELKGAMSRLNTRKARGLSGILPELVLCGSPVLLDRLLVLMQAVWRDGCVFNNWRDALIVPVPKKGDFQFCDNWQGSVCWMLLARFSLKIIQDHLQIIADGLLPNSPVFRGVVGVWI